jgi:hypothetical protein
MFSFSKIFLSIALLACPLLNATIYLPQGITKESVQNMPKEIAWDIHNVLAEKDGGAKAGAILGDIFPIIFSKLSGNAAWKEVDQLGKKEKDISGEAYVRIFTRHGELSLARMAEKAANAYKPRKGMEKLVQDIDNAGITQRLASNIGPICFANLDAKFKSKNCYLFDKMQPGLLINYESFGPYQGTAVANTYHHLCTTNKPHAPYFAAFNALFNPNNDKIIIFVDDKLDIVQAAVAAGMIGIHFDIKQKDLVNTLRNQLVSLGVFTK